MKRILAYVLIFALLGGTSLWGLRGEENGRTYNRDLQKRSGHANWGRCIAKDSDAIVWTMAWIDVDVDTRSENLQEPGVDYSAVGSAWGWAYDGSYLDGSEVGCPCLVKPNERC